MPSPSLIEKAAAELERQEYYWMSSTEEVVRAVLLAIREPTEEMLIAGHKTGAFTMSDEDVTVHLSEAAHVWTAMIDAALKE